LEARDAATQQTGRGAATPAEVKGALTEFLSQLALRDAHREPRAAAAIALGKIGALESRAQLERLLQKDDDHEVRESAALALGMMGAQSSAEVLHRIVADRAQEPALRVYAATAIGLLRDPSGTAPLLKLLTVRDRMEVHVAATMAVGVISDPSALDHLLTLARSRAHAPAVRAAAVTSLGKCGAGSPRHAEVLTALNTLATTNRHDDIRRAVALILPRFADRRALPVLQRIVRADRDDVTRGFALLSMAELAGAVGDEASRRSARALLSQRLTEGARLEQGYAALALGLLGRGDDACAALLQQQLGRQSNASTRAAVAIGLGLCGNATAAAPLAALARDGSTDLLRGYACVALGMVGARYPDPAITAFLTQVVTEVNIPEVRAAAALGLSKMGGGARAGAIDAMDAIDALRKVIHSRNQYLKLSAILTLGYFRHDGTIKDFVELYAEAKQANVRALAVVAMGYVGEKQHPPVLRLISADFNYLAVHDRMRDLEIILRLY
jgi:HEAT repeat protein